MREWRGDKSDPLPEVFDDDAKTVMLILMQPALRYGHLADVKGAARWVPPAGTRTQRLGRETGRHFGQRQHDTNRGEPHEGCASSSRVR
jgi:hypothetical protein